MKRVSSLIPVTLAAVLIYVILTLLTPVKAEAKVYVLPDGTVFDSDFYASLYPEMTVGYAGGKYPERLLWHYLTYGIGEGRVPSLYSMCNPTPATMSSPYVYPAGSYCVVPVQYLYPYYPYTFTPPAPVPVCR
ncbi:MAG: hypothetical protein K6F34_00480 [Lachnospiraceae bacterium]|nr:hypothetical protein [Lachnospiraceae bacterium]